MTIKFDAANSEALTAPSHASFDLNASGWAIGFFIAVDTLATGDTEQIILGNGTGWYVAYTGSGHANPNTIRFNGRDGEAYYGNNNILTAGSKLYVVIQKIGSNIYMGWCPPQATQPANDSAVTSASPRGVLNAFARSGMFSVGGPVSGQPGVFLDQSVCRVFKITGELTLLDIANLAYGKTIADLGKTPDVAIGMNDANDITDTSTNANVFTKVGTLSQGIDPGFGYGFTVSAPVFTAAPEIAGMARAGTARTYTPGVITTNETPTVTRQWTLDGVDISGATGATYTPVTGDIGKALRVREKAVNSAAPSGVTSTSAPVTVLAAAGSTTRTLSFVMKTVDASKNVILAANRTGLRVAVSTGDGPDAPGTTLYQFNGKTTDANGNFGLSFDNGAVAAGQVVLISILGADGYHYVARRAVA